MRGDQFRRDRLYNEDVNEVFRQNIKVLRALHDKFSSFRPASRKGAPTKRMGLDEWNWLLTRCSLWSDDFTRQEARFAFVFARMQVYDEVKHMSEWASLTSTDMLDALGRVAEAISVPTKEEMKDLDVSNAHAYFAAVVGEGLTHERRPSAEFGQPKTRPLAEKVARLLEMMFVELDPSGDGKLTLTDMVHMNW